MIERQHDSARTRRSEYGKLALAVAALVAVVALGREVGPTCRAFLVARYFARDAVARRVEGDARFAAIDRAVERQWDYAVASLGMLHGTLLYVYSGKAVGEVAALAGGGGVQRGAGYYLSWGVGLAATARVTVLVSRIARRALAEATTGRQ